MGDKDKNQTQDLDPKQVFNDLRTDIATLKDKVDNEVEDNAEGIDEVKERLKKVEGTRELLEKTQNDLEELSKASIRNQMPTKPTAPEDRSRKRNDLFGRRLATAARKNGNIAETDRQELSEEEVEELYGELPDEQRALVEDATGQNLVPEDLVGELIMEAEEQAVVRGLVDSMTTQSNRATFDKLTGSVTYNWGEMLETGGVLEESSLTPSQLTIYIEDAYGFSKVGENLLMDAKYDYISQLQSKFVNAKALEDDYQFLHGTKHANKEAEGIINLDDYAGTGESYEYGVSASGTLDFDDFFKLAYGQDPAGGNEVPLNSMYQRNGAFLIHPSTELDMMLERMVGAAGYDGSAETTHEGAYMWQPSLQAGTPNTLRGYPVYTSTNMEKLDGTTGNLVAVFGDLSTAYRVIERMDMTVKVMDEHYAESGMVGYRFKSRLGAGIIQPEAIRIMLDV